MRRHIFVSQAAIFGHDFPPKQRDRGVSNKWRRQCANASLILLSCARLRCGSMPGAADDQRRRVGRVHDSAQSSLIMESPAAIGALQPRGLTRGVAAAYCGLSPDGFDAWVSRGLLPGPIPGTLRWDRKAIDLALDRASGIQSSVEPTSSYDAWRKRREGQDARR